MKSQVITRYPIPVAFWSFNGSFAWVLWLVMSSACCVATAHNDAMVSNASVERSGLVVNWSTQVEVGASGEIVDLDLDISYLGGLVPAEEEPDQAASKDDAPKRKKKMVPENKATVSFLVQYDRYVERISQRDLDAFGKVLGVEGAQQQANLRKEIILAELKARGKENTEVTITKLTLPEATIYALSSLGVVTAIDADTGRIKWTSKIGERRLPSIGLGSNSDYVAAVNGSSIYCLDAENGKILWTKRCESSPSASPAVSNTYIYVPLLSGRVQLFPIKSRGVGSEIFVSTGKPLDQPLITENTVSWPSDKGYYTVAPKDEFRSPIYRLRSNDAIVASGVFKGGILFVNSIDGFVYAINEKKGSVIWEFSTGQRLSESPIALGDYVFVITDEENMYKIDARTGRLADGWDGAISDVGRFVGASEEKMYVLDSVGRIAVIDPNTGARLGIVPSAPLQVALQNRLSDRLFVGNSGGLIQCLHEVGKQFPYFHSPEFDDAAKAKTDAASDDPFKIKDADDADADAGGDDDPFAGGDDAMDAGDADDPFAGGNDPTTKDDEEDPFGGGDDESTDKPGDAGDGNDPFSGGGDQPDDENEDPFSGGTP